MKSIRVGEVYRIYGTATDTVREDTPLEEVIERFAREPGLRGVFVVNARMQFSGVVTRSDLIRGTHYSLFGGKGRQDVSISEFYRVVDAVRVKDLMNPGMRALAVKENDSLQTALDKMLDYEEDLLPVVDNDFRVLGDLRISEVLLHAIEAGKKK